ncbi:shikimate kinase [Desulfacinum hydrothermale DSM 13146]|uniref:Shikimate kinase n=1 Tax=Desulfacinum hydrothermale DSM 13146 TaxID=1121390 RepID=A0A1W1XNS2_9BACT|nr:shikimate kinase [Desulfacinum hydrothermale]SMC25613.1 shikimate kinase [Desulfacinum hydrothermale DSM 13146]
MLEGSAIQRIALIGYRVTGKSTVGPLVARRLGWRFVDMDQVLMERFGDSISGYVALHGWEAFRDAESDLLRELSESAHLVVATGGGVVERETNCRVLSASWLVVWLDCQLSVILNRLRLDSKTAAQRPSLSGLDVVEETARILERRRPLYRHTAHLTLDSSRFEPEHMAEAIVARLRNPSGPVDF